MAKYAFIPSRAGNSKTLSNLKDFFELAGYDVNVLVDKSSIFEAYSGALRECKVKATDKVVMCHDDIEILSSPEAFNDILDSHFKKPKAGFLGVAGTRYFPDHAVWWSGYGGDHKPMSPQNPLCGFIFHGETTESMRLENYGTHANTVVMDGVFLAATGAVLNSIQLNKPKSFEGGWHFYDVFYTYQAFKKGFVNSTAPVLVRHESVGEPDEVYNKNRLAFLKLCGSDLPLQAF
tara:strand:+ start:9874 stop:10575 length:702 start_codon:yes stop_codon:yes gene_type:complete